MDETAQFNLIIVRICRGMMAMLIIVALFSSDHRSQSLATMENNFINSIEHFYHDDGYRSLHIYEANDSITISSQSPHNPQIWKMIHNFGKTLYPPKKGLSDPQKSENESPKKKCCFETTKVCTFCKKPGPIWSILASGASFLIYRRL